MGNCVSGYCSSEVNEILEQIQTPGAIQQLKERLNANPQLLTCRKGLSDVATVWHCAAKVGRLEALRYLVDFAGSAQSPLGYADCPVRERRPFLHMLDSMNSRGHTPLAMASMHGHADCIAFLVSQGSDAFLGDCHQLTPLHHSARAGHVDCIHALAKSALTDHSERGRLRLLDSRSTSGLTALHLAAAFNHKSCVLALLRYGACLVPKTSTHPRLTESGTLPEGLPAAPNSTPLHLAAERGHVDVITTMLRHQAWRQSRFVGSDGIDMRSVRNGHSHVPLQVALRSGHRCAKLLQLLDPSTDLSALFAERLAAAPSVPALRAIACLALRKKLMTEIGQAAASSASSCAAVRSDVLRISIHSDDTELPSQLASVLKPELGSQPAAVCVLSDAGQSCCYHSGCLIKAAHRLQQQVAAGEADVSLCSLHWKDQAAAAIQPLASSAPSWLAPAGDDARLGNDDADDDGDGDEAGTCALCFENVVDVSVAACSHKLCSLCAEQLCARVTDRPPTCPFCRGNIGAFVGSVF